MNRYSLPPEKADREVIPADFGMLLARDPLAVNTYLSLAPSDKQSLNIYLGSRTPPEVKSSRITKAIDSLHIGMMPDYMD